MRGVQIFGIGSLGQWSFLAAAIARITRSQFPSNLVDGGTQFGGSPFRALLGLGVEKDFDAGIREDHGADIPTLHHSRTGGANTALFISHRAANPWASRDLRGSFAHARFSNLCGHVFAVQQHPIVGELNARFPGKLFQAMEIVQRHAKAQSPQSYRTVHRTRVDVGEPQTPGNGTRHCALSGPARAVNGDNEGILQGFDFSVFHSLRATKNTTPMWCSRMAGVKWPDLLAQFP